MRLPSPILVVQIRPPMLVASQLVRHVWAFRLAVHRKRHVVEHPSPRKHIAPLQINPSSTGRLRGLTPPDRPPTVLSRGVASTKSIQDPYSNKQPTKRSEL